MFLLKNTFFRPYKNGFASSSYIICSEIDQDSLVLHFWKFIINEPGSLFSLLVVNQQFSFVIQVMIHPQIQISLRFKADN